ncbi:MULTISPECIES: class I SAM-dependent methyltransferase [unclassified Chelatococcus]|uniref:class I SAM-dependent methyltransferase n=1 Tax=unclassified Chelatococcus TaxID=2638111 RepID=UPI001BCEB5A4|nr:MULTISPECIES: class I SAM-dependent methyltransferase [unclassified Chelatococcus]MBS7699535.1 class I SAM-dependent methyltransferase [Chelatococcus sp. YT9]MBX3560067.1 class I SAM-dependent methyltransferase [Chelatococcus sp.]
MSASVHAGSNPQSADLDRPLSLRAINASLARAGWSQAGSCPACGSASIRPFATLRHIAHDRCTRCGFTFANPLPDDATLAAFYNSSFYNNYRRFEAERIAREPYFSLSYSDLRRLASWIDAEKSARILDFGCGPGSLLALLRDHYGYENCEGLELNRQSAEIAARSYGVRVTTDSTTLRGAFDLVMLVEVIEHIPDPTRFLLQIRDLVRTGGRLFLTTDSVRNTPSRFFPSHSGHFTAPSHVSLFTEAAMARCLERAGFVIERMETEPSETLMGDYLASPFFSLDFLSPQSADELRDTLYVPTRLGRLMGLRERRVLPKALRATKRIDRLLARLAKRLTPVPPSDHLLVMARKMDRAPA